MRTTASPLAVLLGMAMALALAPFVACGSRVPLDPGTAPGGRSGTSALPDASGAAGASATTSVSGAGAAGSTQGAAGADARDASTTTSALDAAGADARDASPTAYGVDAGGADIKTSDAAGESMGAAGTCAAAAAGAVGTTAVGDVAPGDPSLLPLTAASLAPCPCAPGGTVEVITCGVPEQSLSGRDAPDAVVTRDGATVAVNRCDPDASNTCANGVYLWTKATGTMKLAGSAFAFALSADGTTLLAERNPGNDAHVLLWRSGTAFDLLFFRAAFDHGLSADGNVVVSQYSPTGTEDGSVAALWSAATGLVTLGDLPGGAVYSEPAALSPNASAIVGYGNSARGQEPFLWTAACGMIDLGVSPDSPANGDVQSYATAISDDGTTVVGGENATGTIFRWNAAQGHRDIGRLFPNDSVHPFFFVWGPRLYVSADGATVTGTTVGADATMPLAPAAFRWTSANGLQALSAAPSIVRGMSADGTRVLGSVVSSDATDGIGIGATITHAPFISDAHGQHDLATLLTARGAVLTGVTLGDPIALSADGTTVVGHATCGGSEIVYRATIAP